jgi:2-dehydro-3-deoxyphosphogluconate aldolase / (4S)-4-hydroxy-2-oxoglutarate aldolase
MTVPVLDQIAALRVVPIVVIDDAADAPALGDALASGGLPIAEITLRTPAAVEAIERMAAARPDVIVGAGTVRTPEQVSAAIAAGARFLVSAGLDADVVRAAQDAGVPIVPGAVTPTELQTATRLGITTVKFFPADALGGPATIRSLAGPFPEVRFVPTGGVDLETMTSYLDVPAIPACGGSWMAPADLIRARDWTEIARLTAQTVATAAAGVR